jgi:hypothetical protein
MIIFPRFKNKKNGKYYDVIDSCLNATNANNGQIMIIYQSIDGTSKYCREEKEFLEKFEKVEE